MTSGWTLANFTKRLSNVALPIRIYFPIVVLFNIIITVFIFIHLSVYWGKKEDKYFNPAYAVDNNVNKVILHSTFGLLGFFFGPIYVTVSLLQLPRVAEVVAFVVYVGVSIATLVTVVPLSGIAVLGKCNATGCYAKGIVILAGIWGAALGVTLVVIVVMRIIMVCKPNWEALCRSWVIRNVGFMMFGSTLLPILSPLKEKTAVVNLILWIVFVLITVVGNEVTILFFHQKDKSEEEGGEYTKFAPCKV